MPKRLDVPPIPPGFDRTMRIWQELHRHRQTGMGLGNITWPDLYAYSAMNREPLSRGDIASIEIIEDEFHTSRAAADEHRGKADGKGGR